MVLISLVMVAFAFAATTSDFDSATSSASAPKMAKTWWNNTPDTLTWAPITSMTTAVSRCGGAYIGTKYYNVQGEMSGGRYAGCQIWDGTSWTASTATNPNGGVSNLTAAAVNGKVVVGGGSLASGYCNTTSVYDPTAETWANSTPCAASNNLYALFVGLGTKCYSFGGSANGTAAISSVYEWTPGDAAMTAKASMPAVRAYAMGSAYNDKIYIFGGSTSGYTGSNTIWEYTPSTDTWATKTATLATSRCWGTAVTIADKIYIVAGYSVGAVSGVTEIYDPVADTITAGPAISYTTRSGGGGGAVDPSTKHSYTGTIVVAGGYNTGFVANANEGTVTGITYAKVTPRSLGSIKAAYK